jgi:1-acyl-sn-glycerol-3-phosphate acyltransferase
VTAPFPSRRSIFVLLETYALKLRAYLALVVVCLALVVADLVQRILIGPWVKLRPSRRLPVLAWWIELVSRVVTRPFVRIGGATIPVPPKIVPTRPGTLIVMNHQSLFDIPLLVQTVDGGYPRIVTRARYSRFIPVISHMVRLYQYPVVDPTANAQEMLDSIVSLGAAARDADVPIAIFPEGTRTKDGEIGRFKSAGLKRLLSERAWTVYVFVADGFWRVAKFKDFAAGMSHIEGRIAHVATLEWTDTEADPAPFIAKAREMMIQGLVELRAGADTA